MTFELLNWSGNTRKTRRLPFSSYQTILFLRFRASDLETFRAFSNSELPYEYDIFRSLCLVSFGLIL